MRWVLTMYSNIKAWHQLYIILLPGSCNVSFSRKHTIITSTVDVAMFMKVKMHPTFKLQCTLKKLWCTVSLLLLSFLLWRDWMEKSTWSEHVYSSFRVIMWVLCVLLESWLLCSTSVISLATEHCVYIYYICLVVC